MDAPLSDLSGAAIKTSTFLNFGTSKEVKFLRIQADVRLRRELS
jgi:hypothetical protein